ncbi:hypothetical protein CAPTEDRAFT_200452 [Capitella teleta]|uniref:Sulfotransferase domain-containing protein n=1 Tax=Capitella teleta TaxID=283909 RepID=R7TVT8_CAPTE|nr:hypothetical protein CAPTEDRAFT_200452 [Capitella teleta]|eukprot:ELT95586.1 hypothetical protein CAPTEDRAFT_200452 [Capitella teleta]
MKFHIRGACLILGILAFCAFTPIVDILQSFLSEDLADEYSQHGVVREDSFGMSDYSYLGPGSWNESDYHLDQTPSTKVLLMAYMRGGSSLLGEVFNQDPDVFYWYEPLTQFYSSLYGVPPTKNYKTVVYKQAKYDKGFRYLQPWEKQALANYINDMFSCNLVDLPPEVFGNPRFMRHPRATQQFYECYLSHSSFNNRGKPVKAENIKDFTFKDFLWDNTCKETSEVSQFCGKDGAGIEPRCQTIFKAVANWNSSVGPVAFLKSISQETGLPQSILDHDLDHFLAHQVCQERIHGIIKDCVLKTNLLATCHNSPVQVAKVLRVKMTNIPAVLEAVPDIKIIHYVRDPRAIAYSQAVKKKKGDGKPGNFVVLAKAICDEMSRDLFKRSEAQKINPDAFLQVKYEDLVKDPKATVDVMYAHIGRKTSHSALNWVFEATHSEDSETRFGTKRKNALEVTEAWREEVDPAAAREVAQFDLCRSVLRKLAYKV